VTADPVGNSTGLGCCPSDETPPEASGADVMGPNNADASGSAGRNGWAGLVSVSVTPLGVSVGPAGGASEGSEELERAGCTARLPSWGG